MDKLQILFVALCFLIVVSATELSIHDYDIQIHPIHGHHHGYGEHHGYATSVRYDKRYHHKAHPVYEYRHKEEPVLEYHHQPEDVVYQYVSDDQHGDDYHQENNHGY